MYVSCFRQTGDETLDAIKEKKRVKQDKARKHYTNTSIRPRGGQIFLRFSAAAVKV